jgi:predicted lipoprotein with Yx(FWY)xxD motif
MTGSAPPTPVDVSVFEEGGVYVLRNQDGMSLYRYDLDVDGKSHCFDACGARWPPLLVSADEAAVVGEWKTIERGTARQWTYRAKPIYIYAKDSPGAPPAGDGIDGVWHVIAP